MITCEIIRFFGAMKLTTTFSICFSLSCFMKSLCQEVSLSQTCSKADSDYIKTECKVSKKKFHQALVVYDEEKIPLLHKSEREFKFNGEEIKIRQRWSEMGVAGSVWDSAIILANYLKSEDIKDKNVLELGAGTGFVGIAASKLGAMVTITDLRHCLGNIRENLKMNDISAVVRELRWGHDLASFTDDYDYIIGADIIYIEDTFDDLAHTLTTLSNSKTKVLLGCKVRYAKDAAFLVALERFFAMKVVFYDKKLDIHVYLALKKEVL